MYLLRPILKTYYDSLEDGKVLGMKCQDCGKVVWPPLPTCQDCGSYNLD
ncbi:zinc ribbon domain-containing protein [Lentilactobacillus buchneri]|nr:zinc ribbon domain-containing protein [Lentilactobacillus buchneri]